jgi:hypothetical protein
VRELPVSEESCQCQLSVVSEEAKSLGQDSSIKRWPRTLTVTPLEAFAKRFTDNRQLALATFLNNRPLRLVQLTQDPHRGPDFAPERW